MCFYVYYVLKFILPTYNGIIIFRNEDISLKILLGITGSYGTMFAKKAIERLHNRHELYVVVSENGNKFFKSECNEELYDFLRRKNNVVKLGNDILLTQNSYVVNEADCMIILPCSSSCIGRLATGIGNDFLMQAADIIIKERKPLLLATSEAPLSTVTLRNLETLSLSGAIVFPIGIQNALSNVTDTEYDELLEQVLYFCKIK